MTALRDALLGSGSKREVAERLGQDATRINSAVRRDPELLRLWQALPADGAYAGREAGLPRPSSAGAQAESDALVAEASVDLAAAGYPLSSGVPIRHDTVRLILAMYAIAGAINFRRGWVRAVMLAMQASGRPMMSSKAIRWHRSALITDPEAFAKVPGIDPELLDDLSEYG